MAENEHTPRARKFRRVRSKADIQNDPRVTDMWLEESGYWVKMRTGYHEKLDRSWMFSRPDYFSSCLHEDTISELCRQLNEEVTILTAPGDAW